MNHNYNNDGCDAGQNKFRLITIVGVVRHPTYMCFGLIFSPKPSFQLTIIVIYRISIQEVPTFRYFWYQNLITKFGDPELCNHFLVLNPKLGPKFF